VFQAIGQVVRSS